MRGATRWEWLLVGAMIASCDAPELVSAGGRCNSLSDCQEGLLCLAGRCSADVSSLAGNVPEFTPEMPAEEMDAATAEDAASPLADGGAVDASTPRDAAQPVDASGSRPDAGPKLDSGVPDAAAPVDAAPPEDTSVPDANSVDAAEEVDAELLDAQ